MIRLLDVKDELTAINIVDLQKSSYMVEAELINFFEIPPLKDTFQSIKESDEIFYGYYFDNHLCGVISYKLQEETLDIYRIAIDPHYFRKGIARKLIEHIESVNKGIDKILVSTGSKNIPAIKLYLNLGFELLHTKEILKGLEMTFFEKRQWRRNHD